MPCLQNSLTCERDFTTLSQGKQAKLIEHFVAGTSARRAASLIGVDKMTAAYYFQRLREIIALQTTGESDEAFDGEIELDESYFGGRRKGKRGRGAKGKVAIFGLLQRGGKVYAKVIPDAASATLAPIIEKKVAPDSIVYTDCWRGSTTGWTCPGSSTTGSRIFETRRSATWAKTMVFQGRIFRYT